MRKHMQLITNCETDTKNFAKSLAKILKPKDIVVLTGELGSGKTKFVEGFLSYFGLENEISSPTFTIVQIYEEGRIPLYHMDIYRVAASGADLGLDEYFEGDGLSVVEWGNLLEEALPEDYLELILEKSDTDLEKRYVKLISYGEQSETFKQRILEKWAENHE